MAREILELKNGRALFAPMVPGVIERVRTMHLQTNPTLRKDLDDVSSNLRKAIRSRAPTDLMNDIAWLYASRFTEAELKEIAHLLPDPDRQKGHRRWSRGLRRRYGWT